MIYFPICKINIGLNIIEKRPDGYHNIETVFYPIALKDALEIRANNKDKNTILVTGLPINTPSNDDNLCIKAYNIIKRYYPHIQNVDIHLNKAIPMGAGLGGGSSDATYTLKLLNFIFKLNLSKEELLSYASQIGADCAFFVQEKPVFAYEKGDKFEEISINLKGKYILLVKPDIFISTKEAYQGIIITEQLDSKKNLKNVIEDISIEQWKYFVRNDFEISLSKKYKEFDIIKEKLYDTGAIYASLSGSGATMYGIFDKPLSKEEIKQFDYPFVKQIEL